MTQYDRVIPPGKEGKVTAQIKTDNLKGKVHKAITVTTDDPKHKSVRIELQAEIIPIINIDPSPNVSFMRVKHGEVQTREFTIEGETERKLEITDLKSTLDYVKTELSEDGGKYKLKVTLTETAPIGILRNGSVTFNTNYKEKPTMIMRVTGKVDGPILFTPSMIFFANMSKERPETLSKKVTVQSDDGETFKITGVEVTVKSDVKASWETVEPDKKYLVTLDYIGDFQKQSFYGKLKIKTDSKVQPELEIPVSGRNYNQASPPNVNVAPMVKPPATAPNSGLKGKTDAPASKKP